MKNFLAKGFSLIELSVVLIIIAAMAVIFTGGAGLFSGSKVTMAIAELTENKTAESSFVDKYKFLPGDVPNARAVTLFGAGNASTNCSANFGNLKLDNLCEEDSYWLQSSQSGFIKQRINFNPDSAPAFRLPVDHRPLSDVSPNAGWTKIQTDQLPDPNSSATVDYDSIFRLGSRLHATDTKFEGGVLSGAVAREIDRKIDESDTPYTGKLYVSDGCDYRVAGSDASNPERLCVLNFAQRTYDGTGGTINPPSCPNCTVYDSLTGMCNPIQNCSGGPDDPVCPDGKVKNANGQCIDPNFNCPAGYEPVGRVCRKTIPRIECPLGQYLDGGVCKASCTPPAVYDENTGFCVLTIINRECAIGFEPFGEDQCLTLCQSGKIRNATGACEDGTILCPEGTVKIRTRVSPAAWACESQCREGFSPGTNNICLNCLPGYTRYNINNQLFCIPNGVTPECPEGQVLDGTTCVVARTSCSTGFQLENGLCKNCAEGYVLDGRTCVTPKTSCPTGFQLENGLCKNCAEGYSKAPDGKCYPTQTACPLGYGNRAGVCWDCVSGYVRVSTGGTGLNAFACVQSQTFCEPPLQLSNGFCCPAGTRFSGGRCVIFCTEEFILKNNQCEYRCKTGFKWIGNGRCEETREQRDCGEGKELSPDGNSCISKCEGEGFSLVNGQCVFNGVEDICPIGNYMSVTGCVPVTQPLQCAAGSTRNGATCTDANNKESIAGIEANCFNALKNILLNNLGGSMADQTSTKDLVDGFTAAGNNLNTYLNNNNVSACQ